MAITLKSFLSLPNGQFTLNYAHLLSLENTITLNTGMNAALAVPHDRFSDVQKFQCASSAQKHVTLAMILVPESLDIFTVTVVR